MENFRERFDNLQIDITCKLTVLILNSKVKSKFVFGTALPINTLGYVELTLLDGKLIFIDGLGLHYDVDVHYNIDTLIDIIEGFDF